MAAFELEIHGLDGALHTVEVLPSMDIVELKTLVTRSMSKLTKFHNIKLLLGSQILIEGTVAEAGLSATVGRQNLQVVKILDMERVLQDLKAQVLFNWDFNWDDDDSTESAIKLLEGITWLSEEYSERLFEILWQGCFLSLNRETSELSLRICDLFGRICHDPDHWRRQLEQREQDPESSSYMHSRLASAIIDRIENARDYECEKGNYTKIGEEVHICLNSETVDVEHPSAPSHQVNSPALAAGAAECATVDAVDTDDKKDLIKAIDASEAEALQREQADLTKAILESKALAGGKAESAPGRLCASMCSSSCSSWRRTARALPEMPGASEVTAEHWDDVPNICEFIGPATDRAAPTDEEEACVDTSSSLLVADGKTPGTCDQTVTLRKGCALTSNAGVKVLKVISDVSAPPGAKGSGSAQASDSIDSPHAAHGSKRTKDRNRRKRERDSKYKTKSRPISDVAADGME